MGDEIDTKAFTDDTVANLGEDIYNVRLEQEQTSHDAQGESLANATSKGASSTVAGVSDTDFKIRFFSKKEHEVSSNVNVTPTINVMSDRYDMSHKKMGRAIIFNNEKFSSKLKEYGFGDRHGTQVDEQNLKKQLKKLGFEVSVFNDASATAMQSACKEAARLDYTDYDCFAVVILTHGEEGIVYGKDKAVEIKELTNPFRGHVCPSLAGKPKLFFIQACRGYQTDPGVDISVQDGMPSDYPDAGRIDSDVIKLPVDADFLFAYSTVPGYYSWRNGARGSWFIQALVGMLEKHGTTMELLKLLTIVNRIVALNFISSNPGSAVFHRMKQIPCITTMLTKDLYLTKTK